MDLRMEGKRQGWLLLALVAAVVIFASSIPASAAASPVPQRRLAAGDDTPFPLAAPWPSGQIWMAGNGGNYYGDGAHQGSEFYAVDFNRIDGPALGQPIYAAADGTVISAGWLDGYGNSVIIAHRFGVITTYGHLQRTPLVSVGQHVTTATMLGYCGSTGNSTGPHLHFSVRRGDLSLRPEPMEGRRLFDGVFIVAGPKPEPAGDTPALAVLVRSPGPELAEAQWVETSPPAAPEARGGRAGRHIPLGIQRPH